jgi:hypothetical protein
LGNQLFQILYARLVAEGAEPRVVHDSNYPHKFGLSSAFAACRKPGAAERFLSAIRIPKLLQRARLSGSGRVTLGRTSFLDGYFQDTAFYEPFGTTAVRSEIERLRHEFGIDPDDRQGEELHHIRLGDFFTSEAGQRTYLLERLQELPEGAFIVTNREDLVSEAIAGPELGARRLSLVCSGDASPEQTLRMMGAYGTIVSNDSTLAFWAACLAGRRLVTPSPILNALFATLAAT